MNDLKTKITSRKLAVVLTLLASIFGAAFAGEIPWADAVDHAVKVAMAYIAGQGAADAAGAFAPVLEKLRAGPAKKE